MACQVPVISTNSGGIPEIMVNNVTGFMSDVGNIDEMAANTIKLLSDEEMLNKFKQQALERAKEFDIEKILPKYEAYYQKVLQQNLVGQD
jgi:glycosyltransferase involved in cell wall biosynthesis